MEKTEIKLKVSPAQFVREVRQEASRITWPTRKETMISTAMVLVMVVLAAAFFYVVDSIIGAVIARILL